MPTSIAFLLFPDVRQLDLTGPVQVLARLGRAVRLDMVWKTHEPVATDAGFSILPTATFAQIDRADILCVPGGSGSTASPPTTRRSIGCARSASGRTG